MLSRSALLPLLCLAGLQAFAASPDLTKLPPAATAPVDFEKQIRPLFESKCFKCHGAEKQKSGLRLDQKEPALRGGDNYAPAILPGRGAESPLVQFAAGLDDDMAMPPAKSGLDPLTPAEIGLLRAWVDQGAKWPEKMAAGDGREKHWSFQPVKAEPVPAGENAVDHFVTARLREKGLALSAPADRRTLIRRLYFDLIGLPPEPEEIAAFIADRDPRAPEKLVDRLLASPHYGERWAAHWLDVVRFAESNGFETNGARPNAWPFRDYVIRALNDDKPFDRFAMEQIAGDLLGEETATGFLVAGSRDIVKSPDPVLTAQQRADELHDMVSTTGSAFLGLTVGCARCHNHKFDPILQTDYYSVKACFAGVQHAERTLKAPDAAQRQQRIAALETQLKPVVAGLRKFQPVADLGATPAHLRPMVTRGENLDRFTPVLAKFVRFEALETTQLEPCIDELEVFTAEIEPRNIALATHGTKATASGTFANSPLHLLEHVNDGRYGNEWSWISNERGRGWVQLEFPQAERIDRVLWSRDRDLVPRYNDRLATKYTIQVSLDGQQWQTVATSGDRVAYSTEKKPAPQAGPPPGLSTAEAAEYDQLTKRQAEIAGAIARERNLPKVYAGKFGPVEKTFRLARGDATQPKEEVMAGGIGSMGGGFRLSPETPDPDRRLALAKWIASPQNPLTARVIANRLWQHHFGTGIVDTPSDFGMNGARPTHPELLDFLAAELVQHGWSLKRLHRLICTSATYQQQSAPNAAGLRADADARYLWRFPPRRLEAEPLRDAILAITGQLDSRMGGPGFDLFEPNTNYVKVYTPKENPGRDTWRRMIYQSKPRMQLDDIFGTFDCPDAGQVAPKRNVSTTPLQALSLLNSAFLLDQSRLLAERLQRDSGPQVDAQIDRAFQLAFGRKATTEETWAAEPLIQAHGLPAFCRALFNASEFLWVY